MGRVARRVRRLLAATREQVNPLDYS